MNELKYLIFGIAFFVPILTSIIITKHVMIPWYDRHSRHGVEQ